MQCTSHNDTQKTVSRRVSILVTVLYLGTCAVPSDAGTRIVSLSPAMTEIIYALGAEASLVGVTTLCDYPAEAQSRTKVGDFSNPSLERIMGMKPTLVIVHLPEQRRIMDQLKKLDVDVFVSSTRTLDGLFEEIEQIGAMLDRSPQAESLVSAMRTQLTPVTPTTRKRVYVELSPRPIITVGARSFLNELIERAGARNIFTDIQKDYPIVQQEEVIRRDPEIILVLHPVAVRDRAGWEHIDALKHDRVYTDLDQDLLMRPGPRLTKGYNTLKELFRE
jgi:iron complex transport system substrate-binding protein